MTEKYCLIDRGQLPAILWLILGRLRKRSARVIEIMINLGQQ